MAIPFNWDQKKFHGGWKVTSVCVHFQNLLDTQTQNGHRAIGNILIFKWSKFDRYLDSLVTCIRERASPSNVELTESLLILADSLLIPRPWLPSRVGEGVLRLGKFPESLDDDLEGSLDDDNE